MDNSEYEDVLSRYVNYINGIVDLEEKSELSPPPKADSRLAQVEEILSPFSVVSAIRSRLAVSLDHLRCVAILLEKAGALQPFAPFTILRASFENVGMGMWILAGGNKRDIIKRVLSLESQNAWDASRSGFETGLRYHEDTRAKVEAVRGVAEERGVGIIKIDKLKMGESIQVGAEAFTLPGVHLFWTISSGVAHGRRWAMAGSTEIEEMEGSRSGNYVTYLHRSNVHLACNALFWAILAHETLRISLERQSTGRREPVNGLIGEIADQLGGFPPSAQRDFA